MPSNQLQSQLAAALTSGPAESAAGPKLQAWPLLIESSHSTNPAWQIRRHCRWRAPGPTGTPSCPRGARSTRTPLSRTRASRPRPHPSATQRWPSRRRLGAVRVPSRRPLACSTKKRARVRSHRARSTTAVRAGLQLRAVPLARLPTQPAALGPQQCAHERIAHPPRPTRRYPRERMHAERLRHRQTTPGRGGAPVAYSSFMLCVASVWPRVRAGLLGALGSLSDSQRRELFVCTGVPGAHVVRFHKDGERVEAWAPNLQRKHHKNEKHRIGSGGWDS